MSDSNAGLCELKGPGDRSRPGGGRGDLGQIGILEKHKQRGEEKPRDPRIRCPKCSWEPRRGSLWGCICGHVWNTFDTAGLCPACRMQWTDTKCLSCSRWSLHRDWYEERGEHGERGQ